MRPKTLEKIILLDRIRKEVGNGELSQNYLLESSSPGTGKCVTYNTMVKIRHTDTGIVEEIEIGKLF